MLLFFIYGRGVDRETGKVYNSVEGDWRGRIGQLAKGLSEEMVGGEEALALWGPVETRSVQ